MPFGLNSSSGMPAVEHGVGTLLIPSGPVPPSGAGPPPPSEPDRDRPPEPDRHRPPEPDRHRPPEPDRHRHPSGAGPSPPPPSAPVRRRVPTIAASPDRETGIGLRRRPRIRSGLLRVRRIAPWRSRSNSSASTRASLAIAPARPTSPAACQRRHSRARPSAQSAASPRARTPPARSAPRRPSPRPRSGRRRWR